MVRSAPLGFRIEPELKVALEARAAADDRSVSSFVERTLKAAVAADRNALPLGLCADPSVKRAFEAVARARHRPAPVLAEEILRDWLVVYGVL